MEREKTGVWTVIKALKRLFSGILAGVIAVVTSVSLAALVFGGELSDHLTRGIDMALISATLTGLVVALTGSSAFTVAIPRDRTAPILAIMATAIVASAPSHATGEEILVTVLLAIAVTTLLSGVFLYGLRIARAGGLMRFIPSSVLGGFFAGTGWLLALGGLRVMTGLELVSIGERPSCWPQPRSVFGFPVSVWR